ncbi:DUF445 domain-containing protein [Saccharobesus litoralis]|uniref:DUF445 domain-containing protein n=1 Tax=Saccharobesus litoralis TaxID=2172099 RepID=A0A2S0VS22_9ALTE|nr:DUF445 family protein [Saccharobesus litoralis]AWB67004.1 DUF445 domain-containing protein [Saccharobesus litoralis]
MNKSLITNIAAAAFLVAGYLLANALLLSVGVFALAGSVTNWLAVHMLFEKVPGLYGSGVIPARFEDFKQGIKELMMTQFFTAENIDNFLTHGGVSQQLDLAPVIENTDLSPAFDSLVKTIEESSFGGMLAMFGGSEALVPLKEPFINKMKAALLDIAQSEAFADNLVKQVEQPSVMGGMRDKVETIIEKRLNELTPQLVKQIIQDMIKQHLGWLVVWGGVFGGLIGLIAALLDF